MAAGRGAILALIKSTPLAPELIRRAKVGQTATALAKKGQAARAIPTSA